MIWNDEVGVKSAGRVKLKTVLCIKNAAVFIVSCYFLLVEFSLVIRMNEKVNKRVNESVSKFCCSMIY